MASHTTGMKKRKIATPHAIISKFWSFGIKKVQHVHEFLENKVTVFARIAALMLLLVALLHVHKNSDLVEQYFAKHNGELAMELEFAHDNLYELRKELDKLRTVIAEAPNKWKLSTLNLTTQLQIQNSYKNGAQWSKDIALNQLIDAEAQLERTKLRLEECTKSPA